METTELMINDWVHLVSTIHNVSFPEDGVIQDEGYTTIRTPIKLTTVSENCVSYYSDKLELYITLSSEDIEPIPLTPEILEKNGFENIPYAGIDCDKIWLLHEISYYGKSFPLYTDDIMLKYSTSEQCWCVFFNIGGAHPDFRTVSTISYVHELQHVLKLYGIEKEIIV